MVKHEANEDRSVYCIIAGIVMILISIALIIPLALVIMKPVNKFIGSTIEASCTTVKYDNNTHRCCDETDCNLCKRCRKADTCSLMLEELREGDCCGGTNCCNEECDRCCSKRNQIGHCIKRHDCRCKCLLSVEYKCQIVCGNCYDIVSTIEVVYTDKKEQVKVKVDMDQFCGSNETQCVENFDKEWKNCDNTKCWYNPTYDADNDAHNGYNILMQEEPVRSADFYAAIAFIIVVSIALVAGIIITILFSCFYKCT